MAKEGLAPMLGMLGLGTAATLATGGAAAPAVLGAAGAGGAGAGAAGAATMPGLFSAFPGAMSAMSIEPTAAEAAGLAYGPMAGLGANASSAAPLVAPPQVPLIPPTSPLGDAAKSASQVLGYSLLRPRQPLLQAGSAHSTAANAPAPNLVSPAARGPSPIERYLAMLRR